MAELLAAASQIPIAQLTPDLPAPSARYIRAVVTLIWPYSSSTSTLKVLLAEPDFRLRRTKGQVRVQFSGSSAKTVFEAGIGSGDEFTLSLDGVEWTKDESVGHTPGRSIDWELKFSERLVLKIQQDGSERTSLLEIDHPARIPEPEVSYDIPELEPIISPPKSKAFNSTRPGLIRSETNEWSSPAFVKRARVSYGSLFESGYDIFAEEDGTVLGKGRKRTRFSRQSGGWRYSSRSQSPESSPIDEKMTDLGPFEPEENQKPTMTDEGCQTLGSREDNAAEALADLSGQQISAILSEGRPDVHQPGPINHVEGLGTTESSTDMLPPATPLTALDGENQGGNVTQEMLAEARRNSAEPSQTGLAKPDNLHGETSDEPFGLISGEIVKLDGPVEVEDLYGLSPMAEDYSRNENYSSANDQTRPAYNGKQVELRNDQQEDTESMKHHTNQISYPKLLDHSTLPDEVGDITTQEYAEPIMGGHKLSVPTSPHSVDQSQNHPAIQVDELNQQPERHWDMQAEDVETFEDHPIPDQISIQRLPARLFSPAGIAMSRSQSGSEMIDLTEDSDENDEEANENLHSDDEEDTVEQPYQLEDHSDEEEGYESLLYNEYESESVENDFNYDHHTIRRPIRNLGPGEVADDEDDLDSEGHYSGEGDFDEENLEMAGEGYYEAQDEVEDEDDDEEDDTSEEEDVPYTLKEPRRDEPEVIDLLSSDGEDNDEEDVNASPADLASEEGAAVKLNLNSPTAAEEPISEGDSEADIEESDNEQRESRESSKEHLHETRHNHFGTDKQPGTSISRHELEEIEVEDSSRTNGHTAGSDVLPSVLEGSKDFQVGDIDKSNSESATGDKHIRYRGYDGTVDGAEPSPLASREAEKDETAITRTEDEVLMDQVVKYPVLPAIDTISENRSIIPGKSAQGEYILREREIEQLPTPDATQLTDSMAVDTSFGVVESFLSPSTRIELSRSNMDDTDSSPHREVSDTAHTGDVTATVTEIRTSSPRDVVIESTTENLEMTTEAFARDTTRDFPADAATEAMLGEAPEISSNAAVEVAEKAIVEVVNSKPVTPRRSKRLSFTHQEKIAEKSPSINMNEPTTPEDYDASVELAMAALDSPIMQSSNDHHISDKEMRIKLSRPLRTDIGDFTTLKLIRFNLERKLDVLALVTTLPSEPQRAKAGLRHYHLRFNITDTTIAPSGVVAVNVFRPYKMALPVVQPGDVVLLRSFLVKSDKGAGFALRSDDGSSWVVFKANGEEQIKGPPVEYGDAERSHVSYLKVWYRNLDLGFLERLEKANGVTGSDMDKSLSKAF